MDYRVLSRSRLIPQSPREPMTPLGARQDSEADRVKWIQMDELERQPIFISNHPLVTLADSQRSYIILHLSSWNFCFWYYLFLWYVLWFPTLFAADAACSHLILHFCFFWTPSFSLWFERLPWPNHRLFNCCDVQAPSWWKPCDTTTSVILITSCIHDRPFATFSADWIEVRSIGWHMLIYCVHDRMTHDDAHAWHQVVHPGLHHQHGLDKAHRPWRLSCLALPLISVAMREVRVLNRSCCRPQRCLALAILDLRLQQGRWFGHNLLSHREKEVQLGRFLLGHLLELLFGVPRSKRRQVKHREVKIVKKHRKHMETC